jgi:AAA15 family ATPase/GTPase
LPFQDLKRQDEIWFAEKGIERSSKLYSLSDYKVKSDTKHKLGLDYLAGRYGAIPILKNDIYCGTDDD